MNSVIPSIDLTKSMPFCKNVQCISTKERRKRIFLLEKAPKTHQTQYGKDEIYLILSISFCYPFAKPLTAMAFGHLKEERIELSLLTCNNFLRAVHVNLKQRYFILKRAISVDYQRIG